LAPGAPTLELYAAGVRLTSVAANQFDLEIRLTPGAGDSCNGCKVQVQPSGSADREAVTMASANGYYAGTFTRELSDAPNPGDGRLQHLIGDSIVLIYQDAANPKNNIRKSYPV